MQAIKPNTAKINKIKKWAKFGSGTFCVAMLNHCVAHTAFNFQIQFIISIF